MSSPGEILGLAGCLAVLCAGFVAGQNGWIGQDVFSRLALLAGGGALIGAYVLRRRRRVRSEPYGQGRESSGRAAGEEGSCMARHGGSQRELQLGTSACDAREAGQALEQGPQAACAGPVEGNVAYQELVRQLGQIIEQAPAAILVIDADHRVLHWNKACEWLTGVPAWRVRGTRSQWEGFYESARPLLADLVVDDCREDALAARFGRVARRPSVHEDAWEVEEYCAGAKGQGSWMVMMAAPIRMPTSEIVGAIQISRDVTERKRAAMAQRRDSHMIAQVLEHHKRTVRQLEAARGQAEETARLMGEFVANMSHEIRTPLSAVLGYADILVDENWGRKSQEYAEIIKRNGEHLLAIINDILDLSKIEAGRLEMVRAECSPHDIVSEVTSLLRVRAESKGLSLETIYDGRVPEGICTDAMRVRQILLNLIGNAIKFTERGGVCVMVRLAVEGSDAALEIEVADSGIGMTPAQIRRLFRPFQQVDAAVARQYGGTGLGLAMSERLAGLLGGHIRVESEAGHGSVFRLILPAGPVDRLRLITYGSEAGESSQRAKTTSTDRLLTSPLCAHVLLAEDGLDSCRLIKLILEKAGADVTVARNGREAVELALGNVRDDDVSAQPREYDVILMDMQMPVMDGYAATRELRGRGYTGPIVALTASAMPTDRARCLEAGCDDFAAKPVNRAELVEMMQRYANQPAMTDAHS